MGKIFLVIFTFWLIRWAFTTIRDSRARARLEQELGKGLQIRCKRELHQGDEDQPVLAISVSGAFHVPTPAQSCAWRVRISDVTEAEPAPVLCMIRELADEGGWYAFDQDVSIPHELCSVSDMPLTAVPLFALVPPKGGRRHLEIEVFLTGLGSAGPDTILTGGSRKIWHEVRDPGYTEWKERSIEQERLVAGLALAVSASDGSIDATEFDVIRQFFVSRFADMDDADERRTAVRERLEEIQAGIRDGRIEAKRLVEEICNDIGRENQDSLAQAAFELCVKVVGADGVVEDDEAQALDLIARRLGLPSDFVKEAKERNLRLAMFDDAADEELVGMPRGLSPEDKLAFLNKEYRKWRSRANHKDLEVAAEASLRLEQVTRLRRQLTDAA